MLSNIENESATAVANQDFRLPKSVVPSHYTLHLSPDLVKFVFDGQVTIDVDILESTDTIKLNAKDLDIASFSATSIGADSQKLQGKVSVCSDKEIATIKFEKFLAPGKYSLESTFTGTLNDKLKGFYRSVWTDEKGGKHPIATTQFESTDARRAFPCFDEPEFKATFDVQLTVPEDLTALSNGAIIKTEKADNGKKTVTYERTMKMSTYLVCFCVGEFVSSAPVNVNGIEVRIWSIPGKEKLTDFAQACSSFAIDFYEKYFEIPYPGGKKIDHIAIPDFASGAMENLGLITYRETALLLDDKNATHAERKRVAEVVMHELAHMWFGDLVTMSWWNGLWLNESFATFMENLCLHNWKPEWEIWNDFGLSRAAASRVDALKSTHPIECAVNHPDEAAEMFDVISYEKGCSVLYQIHEYVGGETFRRGIAAYLKRHSYKNTETHDLWDALEEACQAATGDAGKKADPSAAAVPVPVRMIMDKWVFTSGHPVVAVKGDIGKSGSVIELSQKPFKFLSTDEKTLWPIPLTVKAKLQSGQIVERRMLMDGATHSINCDKDLGGAIDWVVVNAGGSGFYRVTYSKELASALTKDAQKNLTAIERFNLLNDAWACVRAGMLSAQDYLHMVRSFVSETDPNVWAIITASLGHLHGLTAIGSQPRKELAAMIRELVKPTADRLGLAPKSADESVQVKQLRGSLIGVLGTIGDDAQTIKAGQDMFDKWKADRQSIDTNVVPAAVSITAYHGDEKRYEEFSKLSKEATAPQEVQRFLFSLARFRKHDLLEKTIQSCMTEAVRTQDAPYLFAALLGNEEAGSDAWQFLKRNWQDMIARYPENGVVRMVGAVSALDKAELAKDVTEFFAKNPVKSGDMAVAQALEQLSINVQLREREADNLSKVAQAALAQAKG